MTLAFFSACLVMTLRQLSIQTPPMLTPALSSFALLAGLTLSLMLLALGSALRVGPSGLTFATLNSSSMMPSLLMTLFLGKTFGFVFTYSQGFGFFFVFLGLFWGAKKHQSFFDKKAWISYALLAFLLHVLFLLLIQLKTLLTKTTLLSFQPLSLEEAKSQWFTPLLYLSAFLIQFAFFLTKKIPFPIGKSLFLGFLGGIFNCLSTVSLIQALETATPREQTLIFPLFSVLIVLFCSLWGFYFYEEKPNFKALALCLIGLFIGSYC